MVTTEEARQSLAEEWEAKNPQTPDEIAAFYRTSSGMEADLAAWHATPFRRGLTQAIAAAATMIDARSVLDVGAGLGHDLLALEGRERMAVEPNDALRRQLKIMGFPAVTYIDEVAGPFDLITCIDVLEHLPDPAALVDAMVARLAPDGLLIERTSTYDAGTPLHLEALRGWTPGPQLAALGFIPRWQLDGMAAWQRVPGIKQVAPATVLLCAYRALSVETFECVTELSWPVLTFRGDALISRVRSRAVSQWFLTTDEDVFLMIDDDIAFKREDAAKVVDLARKTRGIACGAYSVRDGGHLACRTLVPGERIRFGDDAEPMEIRWAATGFMAAHRDVIEAIAQTMPLCQNNGGMDFWPLFLPSVITGEDGVSIYLSEDYAFCQRAKDLGFKVWMDPSIGLIHYGQTGYTVWKMKNAELTERAR